MWKSHLIVTFRSLRRRRGYALLNIAGLAVGLACCAVLALYVWGELAYDRFHEHADRVHRIESVWGGGDFSLPATNWRFVEALRADYPRLEVATLLRTNGSVRYGDRLFRENDLLFANPAFFDVFSFDLDRGDATTALAEPYTVVLAPETARRYFGDADPIGRTLRLFGDTDFAVTGVLAEPPGPTHVPLNLLLSWPTLDALGWTANQQWGNNSVYTYLLLPEGMEPGRMAAALPGIAERHAGEDWNGAALGLQALPDVHLYSHHSMELSPNGNPVYVGLFAAIAGFILLLACVNFVNLSTARSLERAKEVGVRKAVGAARGQLARQFLSEAMVLALGGLLGAGLLVAIALPTLEGLVGRPLLPGVRTGALAVALALGLTLVAGLGSGLYPALALSRFRPAEVLRGRFATSGRGRRLREGLVVFQFAVAMVLLAGTLVVYGQLRHLREATLGFDEAQVLALHGPGVPTTERLAFFDALRAHPSVEAVASTSEMMPAELLNGNGLMVPGAVLPEGAEDLVSTRAVYVSADFFETLGVSFLAGRDFSAHRATDSTGVILNEAAARQLMAQVPGRYATPEALVGESVETSPDEALMVLGVVPDFHLASLHTAVEPIGFYLAPVQGTYLVRARPGAAAEALDVVRRTWAERFPESPLEYRFLDAAFDAAYRTEERLGWLAMLFAGLAILVACLGLFGLAAYAVEQRRKEVGVRKVLGASIQSVMVLLSKDFARLVLIAVVAAAPVAYVGMSRWLDGFASRMEMGAWPFLAAGALCLLIALLTVSSHAFRAATADPVQSLRSE